MKKKIFFGVAAVAIAAVTIIACKRNFDKFDARGTTAGTLPPAACCDSVGTAVLSGVINSNRTLSCDTIYVLNGKLYISNNATLTIDPGTVIRANRLTPAANASAIIVTRGSKIEADGDVLCPIVFTSNEACPQPGDWGGIVLLGRAPINKADTTIEGINLPTVPAGVDVKYGGGTKGQGNCLDNSGILRYVRIEYAGQAIATDNELNGLTCGGVGAGTTLDFIEVYKGNDDAFEFFGGTVNAKHLFAFEPDDDAFDFDFGFRGGIQFAVSVLTPQATYSANPNGIESDNDGQGSADTPVTRPTISNMTVIGLCDSATAAGKPLLNAAQFRRASRFCIVNSIFMGFPTGLNVSGAGTYTFTHNIVHAFTTPAAVVLDPSNKLYRYGTHCRTVQTTPAANDSIKLASPFACTYDFRPLPGSPALTLGTTTPSCAPICTANGWSFTSTNYRGAFAATTVANSDWLAGWTKTWCGAACD